MLIKKFTPVLLLCCVMLCYIPTFAMTVSPSETLHQQVNKFGYNNIIDEDLNVRSIGTFDNWTYSGTIYNTEPLVFLYATNGIVNGTFDVYINNMLLSSLSTDDNNVMTVTADTYTCSIKIMPKVTGNISVKVNVSAAGSKAIGILAQKSSNTTYDPTPITSETNITAPSFNSLVMNDGMWLDISLSVPTSYCDGKHIVEYVIYRGKTKVDSYSSVGYPDNGLFTATSFNVKKRARYKVCARIKNTETGISSPWSYGYSISAPEINGTKVEKSIKLHSFKAAWKKVDGATKYIVYASTKQKSGYKKVATTKKTSCTVSKIGNKIINTKNHVYFYVVAVSSVNGKTIKSNKIANEVYSY